MKVKSLQASSRFSAVSAINDSCCDSNHPISITAIHPNQQMFRSRRENKKEWTRNGNMGTETMLIIEQCLHQFIAEDVNILIICEYNELKIRLNLAVLKKRAIHSVQLRAVNICLSWYILYFLFICVNYTLYCMIYTDQLLVSK